MRRAAIAALLFASTPLAAETIAGLVLEDHTGNPLALVELPSEWPNPLKACPSYAFPVGVPITIQLGVNVDAKLTSYALTQGSKAVEACGFDSSTYSNPDPVELRNAVGTMKMNGEVVIIPRRPLERGATYEVSATVNDQPYSWSFTVSR